MNLDKVATSCGSDLIIRLVCLLIKRTDPKQINEVKCKVIIEA